MFNRSLLLKTNIIYHQIKITRYLFLRGMSLENSMQQYETKQNTEQVTQGVLSIRWPLWRGYLSQAAGISQG